LILSEIIVVPAREMTPEMETASTALHQLLSDVTMATNSSSDVTNATTPVECADRIPMTGEFLANLSVGGYVLLAFLFLFTAMTVGIYIEEITFILRTFKIDMRKKKTIWILAFFPVYAVCGCLAVIVPRSGPLVDMVANSFFGTCLYNFGRLMMNYMGGGDRIWDIVGHDRYIAMNTPPCCCCCVCIPPQHLNRSLLMRITMQILQVAIVRPVIMFFAAILWTNESYYPGSMNLNNGFIYITIVNLTSTLVAVYGLLLMRGAFRQELEKDFVITGKILSIQLTLLSSAIPNLIIGILVATDVIP
jgi:organic solute transporter subunit alpha